jgi:type III secretion system FlhB-like substrate exporter
MLRQQHEDVVDSRVRTAQEAGVHVVSDRWLLESVAARTLLDDIPYAS